MKSPYYNSVKFWNEFTIDADTTNLNLNEFKNKVFNDIMNRY